MEERTGWRGPNESQTGGEEKRNGRLVGAAETSKERGVVVRASASQSVDLGFIPLVESYRKTLKNGIRSFPAWRSAFRGGCGEQAGKCACCVLGQGT